MALTPASNPLFHALLCGFLVQLSKVLTFLFREKKINFRRLVETGGMPSSHAASVSALSTCVGLLEGFDSVLFNVVVFFSLIVMYDAAGTLYFSLVVMYDAAGLRRAAGRQAMVLNRLIEEHFTHPEEGAQKLMELLGHTPLEVLVGAIIGVLFSMALFRAPGGP